MRWLLRVLGYSTLLVVPCRLASNGYQNLLSIVAQAIVDLIGRPFVVRNAEVFAPVDLGIFVAMCLATSGIPPHSRRNSLLIGLCCLIALEKDPMALENEVKALKVPALIIAGDADVMTLEHTMNMFRLLGGGIMGDMGKPLPASRVAIMPATSHTAVISQPDLLLAFIEPFLKGVTPKGFMQP